MCIRDRCSDILGLPVLDGVASVCIGLVLAGTAIFLAYETKALLIGESAKPETVEKVRALANAREEVDGVNEVLTMHMGPNDVLLNLSLDFVNLLDAGRVEQCITELETEIKAQCPNINRIFIEVQSRAGHAGA